MTSFDNAFRNKTIPYFGQVFGYNSNEYTDQDISQATNRGDLQYLANPTTLIPSYGGAYYPQKDNYVRILKAARAELVAAYLSMSLQMAASEPASQFYISVTKTVSDTDLTITNLTDAQIKASHAMITGNPNPFSNTAGQLISVSKLDITDAIGKFGTADYRKDCFVIGVHFVNTPVAAGFHLWKFSVEGSALVVA